MKLDSILKVAGFFTVTKPMSRVKASLVGAGIGGGVGAIIPVDKRLSKSDRHIERAANIGSMMLGGALIGDVTADLRNIHLKHKIRMGNLDRQHAEFMREHEIRMNDFKNRREYWKNKSDNFDNEMNNKKYNPINEKDIKYTTSEIKNDGSKGDNITVVSEDPPRLTLKGMQRKKELNELRKQQNKNKIVHSTFKLVK